MIRLLLLSFCWLLPIKAASAQQYNREVLPILSEFCFACHGFDSAARQANLRLDVAEGAIAEADSGLPAVVPFHPDKSELIRRIEATDPDSLMPPVHSGKQLSDKQRQVLRNWIVNGAKYQKHWSFEPPLAIEPPQVVGVEHPLDRFIQARLLQDNVAPSPVADDATLLRRVSLDLTGLPPSLEAIDAFLEAAKGDRDQAYLEVVERLLQSSHYGERWGRWWLDQARYADSNGYSVDAPRQIWKYRDWVIAALNRDMPFDQFTIEQLAGDLLPDANQDQQVATGFHRNTQINQEGGIDKEQFRIDSVFDRVATTGTVWLGLTIGCAQCHDHKFDPIEQREYYQLFAFFNNQDEPTLEVVDQRERPPELRKEFNQAEEALDTFIAAKADDYQAWESRLTSEEISKLSKSAQQALKLAKDKRNPKQARELFSIEVGKIDAAYQALLQRVAELEEQVAGITTTLVLAERNTPRTTTVFIKGDFTRPAQEVAVGTPAVLHQLPTSAGKTPNRLDLARWIVHPDNPLTARVIVNRVWQVYFGRGIVETENDFGSLGSPPTHPDLLDWLAVQFQQQNWRLKDLHRLIVTSHTYRQSSAVRNDLQEIDPKNYLLGRQQRLRLEGELVRDASLAACGLLSEKLGGPPVFPPIPDGVMDKGQVKRAWKVSEGEDRYRRGIYTFVYRATPPPALNVFDAPDGYSTCTRRSRSNTPLQALTLLNDGSFFEFATALAKIVQNEGPAAAFRRCTSRPPSEDELQLLSQLDPLSAARVMLNLDETITRE
jgi:Protein of unknown function (DUF1553)/Protein of unknown function (DUF1549)/Planctomycete cytochrome C